jgi:asparagine synthase (glutamine-hydrolysing)
MGFGVPLAQWFRTDLKELAHNVLFNHNTSIPLNNSTVKLVWDEHQRGLRNRSTELWTLLMFRLWERQFMEANDATAAERFDRVGVVG